MSVEDGIEHGPARGCTYRECGNPESDLPCPFVKEGSSAEPAPMVHQHDHNTPVEWQPSSYMPTTAGNRDYSKPVAWTVTRLRCACGQEIERKPTRP